MGTILEDVFLGTAEKYNQKLEMLARMAQPEKWTYKRIQDKDPYRILRNYIQYTYNRLDEEGKIISSADGKYRSMKCLENSRGFSMAFLRRRISFLQRTFLSFLHWLITATMLRI